MSEAVGNMKANVFACIVSQAAQIMVCQGVRMYASHWLLIMNLYIVCIYFYHVCS